MRGVETRIQEIRHKIFTEVARMAYHTEWPVKERMEELPYKIFGACNCRRTPASGNGPAKPQCCRACPGIRWH